MLQCVEGQLEVSVGSEQHALHAGQMLHLPGNVPHAVLALADSSALLTIVVRK
ncbi:Cupin domain protein [compost metagenome]